MSDRGVRTAAHAMLVALVIGLMPAGGWSSTTKRAGATDAPRAVPLPGHDLAALADATPLPAGTDSAPLALTFVLKRDDQAGFDRYLRDVYDPRSSAYRRFLTPREIADRFGPSPDAYDRVRRYLRTNGFELAEGSPNRLTLTVRGTRLPAR